MNGSLIRCTLVNIIVEGDCMSNCVMRCMFCGMHCAAKIRIDCPVGPGQFHAIYSAGD